MSFMGSTEFIETIEMQQLDFFQKECFPRSPTMFKRKGDAHAQRLALIPEYKNLIAKWNRIRNSRQYSLLRDVSMELSKAELDFYKKCNSQKVIKN